MKRWQWIALGGGVLAVGGFLWWQGEKIMLLPIRGLEHTSDAFQQRVMQMGKNLGVDPNWLVSVMAFETSGTLSPSIRNSLGFTGLIQFGSPAAKDVGTTTAALASMSAEDQLEYVERYFKNRIRERGPMQTFTDVYMAVLWPAAMGRGDDFVLFSQGSSAYSANAALDRGQKGYVTAGDAASFPKAIYNAAVAASKTKVG